MSEKGEGAVTDLEKEMWLFFKYIGTKSFSAAGEFILFYSYVFVKVFPIYPTSWVAGGKPDARENFLLLSTSYIQIFGVREARREKKLLVLFVEIIFPYIKLLGGRKAAAGENFFALF